MSRHLRHLLCGLAACVVAWLPARFAHCDDAGLRDSVRQLRSTLPGQLHPRHLTVLGLRVGNDRLDALGGSLGQAAAFSPDGAPQLLTTCFVDDMDRGLAVMFQAQRYDPSRRVTMAHIGVASALQGDARRCRTIPGLASSAATASGIYPGMTRAAFVRQFPYPASEETAELLGYYFFQPLEAGRCQLLSGVRARFGADGLSSITVYRLYRGKGC